MVLLAITCSKPQQTEKEFGIDLKRDQQPLAELGPAQDRLCAECHPAEVADFKSHGMADSIAVLDAERIPAQLSSEFIASPNSNIKYNVGANGSWHVNAVHEASSTSLSIPISHRIGAGVADMSFVINQNGRWFFSPLEFFTHRGWHPAPHEVHSSGGLNSVPITAQCLQCHTSSPIPDVYPYNNFGDYQPQPISCATCHGDGDAHVNLMRENKFASDVKILNPRDLSPERQLDICARCHLEGDAHIDLRGRHNQQLAAGENLLDAHAVLVANESAETELRFVSQVQRLSQSECFQQSPQMTCTTCHDPHQAARFQHSADFDAKCQACHSDFKELHRDQTDTANCAECHMPAARPFDLENVSITDHFIRTTPSPQADFEYKLLESPEGDWRPFAYRGQQQLYSPTLIRAIQAMTLFEQGHHQRASELFDSFAAPGTTPEVNLSQFHFLRGRNLSQRQQNENAILAYKDALKFDSEHVPSMINLANLLIENSRPDEAQQLANHVISRHPQAEAAYNVLILAANSKQDFRAMKVAAIKSLECNPNQPAIQSVLSQLNARNL